MFVISAAEVLKSLSSFPSRREFPLREFKGELAKMITRHEVEILAVAETAGRKPMIQGQANKKGLLWVQLLVDKKAALRLLRQKVASSGSIVADDNRTVDRTRYAGGGVVYSPRRDIDRIWQRKRHWSHFGAPDRGNKAVLVIPRAV